MVNWLAHEILLSPSFSWWFPQYSVCFLILVFYSTVTWKNEVKSLLSISPCHNQELTLSTAHTDYSKHWVQHTLSIAYSEYCVIPWSTVACSQPVSLLTANHVVLNSLHSHNYKLTNEWSLSSRRASLPINRLKNDRLELLLHSCTIMSSTCISNPTRSQHPSVSLKSLDYGLQVHIMSASKCISKLARSRPPSASPNSHDHGLQVHLQTHSKSSSQCISKLAWLQPPNSVLYGLKRVLCIMRSHLSTPVSPKYILPVAESISVITLFSDV